MKFALAVGKCQGFCRGIPAFYSICLGNKNGEAVKFLEIKKKVFMELKKKFFVKEKNISSIKKNFFTRQIIHVHLYSLFITSFCIFLKLCVHYFSLFLKEQYVSWLFRMEYFEKKFNLQLFYLPIVSQTFILSWAYHALLASLKLLV